MIKAIAAIDKNNGLANQSGIPWDLPSDREYFKSQTLNSDILMGYNTYKEFKAPLVDRQNFVLVRENIQLRPGFLPVNNIDSFISEHPDAWIVGGESIYRLTLPYVQELHITQISSGFECTKFMPDFKKDFQLVSESNPIKENDCTFSFQIWKKSE